MLMVSTIVKMKNLHDSTTSHHIVRNQKRFGRLFCFPIRIRLYSFCRAFEGTSSEKQIKILSFSQAEIHAKLKGLPNIFYYAQYGEK